MPQSNQQSGDKGNSPPQDATVEQRFAALLEIGDTPPDPQTPPGNDADEKDARGDDDASDEDAQDEPSADDDTPPEEESESEEDVEGKTDDADDELVFTVKVDGQEMDVDASELVAGYQRQQDYSRKTAKLSEERKAFDGERQAVQQERAKYASLLDKLEATIEAGMPQQPDWAKLRAENPQEYAVQWAEHQAMKEKLASVRAEKEKVHTKQQEDNMAVLQQHVDAEREKLIAAVPEWKDPAKLREGTQAITTYATGTLGLSEEDLAQVIDHRAVLVLRKAMLYDQLQGNKPRVRKKAKGAPTIKPGAKTRPKPKQDRSQRARERLKKDGSMTAATDAFLAMLEGK